MRAAFGSASGFVNTTGGGGGGHGVSKDRVIRCWVVGALGEEAWEGEEEHQCQKAGSVMQFLTAHWKHPSILLLIEATARNSNDESRRELSFLNAALLHLRRRRQLCGSEHCSPIPISEEEFGLKALNGQLELVRLIPHQVPIISAVTGREQNMLCTQTQVRTGRVTEPKFQFFHIVKIKPRLSHSAAASL
jgi:hypothetical protein